MNVMLFCQKYYFHDIKSLKKQNFVSLAFYVKNKKQKKNNSF